MTKKKILFEGDSWFAYPETPGISNIYLSFQFINDVLAPRKRYHIHSQVNSANLSGLASYRNLPLPANGDTIAEMARSDNHALWKTLEKTTLWALILSGGGNDIIAELKAGTLIKKYNPNHTTPSKRVNTKRLTNLLGNIRGDYQYIINYCKNESKNKKIHILAHDYTLFKPSGIASQAVFGFAGVLGVGPWLKTALEEAEYPDNKIPTAGQEALNYIAKEFSDSLKTLDEENKNFHLVSTQGIKGLNKYLIDEVHLSAKGCTIVAYKFIRKLDALSGLDPDSRVYKLPLK